MFLNVLCYNLSNLVVSPFSSISSLWTLLSLNMRSMLEFIYLFRIYSSSLVLDIQSTHQMIFEILKSGKLKKFLFLVEVFLWFFSPFIILETYGQKSFLSLWFYCHIVASFSLRLFIFANCKTAEFFFSKLKKKKSRSIFSDVTRNVSSWIRWK